jgi:hypothetical protein
VWGGTDEYGVYEGATISNYTLIVAGTENGAGHAGESVELAYVEQGYTEERPATEAETLMA